MSVRSVYEQLHACAATVSLGFNQTAVCNVVWQQQSQNIASLLALEGEITMCQW